MSTHRQSNYRWYILALSAMTGTLVAAVPFSSMPVLFKEMSEDLGLSLVQVGIVWGATNLAAVFVSLVGGLLGDWFGIGLVLGIACLLAGITGALRGISTSFLTLAITVFSFGIIRAIIPVNLAKTVALWFRERNLGMANGVFSMGMGLGLMLGPMISATLLSPLLGGWRNVMFLYGIISIVVSIFWFLFGSEPRPGVDSKAVDSRSVPFRQVISDLIRIKNLWFLGLTLMFRMGSIMGMMGYLPLYLRERGWTAASADGTLAAFFAASTICVVPLSMLSDRIGSRKAILFPGLIVAAIALFLLPVVEDSTIWVLIILAGVFWDAFMAVSTTMLIETEGVGLINVGTALGMVFTITQLGAAISPPVGNSFASINAGLPFIFWAVLSVASVITLAFAKETGWRGTKPIKKE